MLRVRRQAAPSALEIIELNMLRDADDDSDSLDLVLSFVTPRSGHGRPYLDVGLLYVDDKALSARSSRADVAGPGRGAAPVTQGGSWRTQWTGATLDLGLTPIAHRAGVLLAQARGRIEVL